MNTANYAVLGAFGKMGSGIATIVLASISTKEYSQSGFVSKSRLHLIDPNDSAAPDIQTRFIEYLRSHAEKNISSLRVGAKNFPHLIENHEIIEDFIHKAMSCTRIHNDTNGVKDCDYIFEAATEFEPLKIKLLLELKNNNPQAYFLTNTSSIPIYHLAKGTKLEKKIIGYHFYNPPVKQKLLELVIPQNTDPKLIEAANQFTKDLRKTAIHSHDIAGFIGNGHFMREALHACNLLGKENQYNPQEALELDTLTRELLIRPMGILQLCDYIGLDVCSAIMKVMTQHLQNEKLEPKLINHLLSIGVNGGQNPNGTQKNGFFQYNGNKIEGIYDINKKEYVSITTLDNTTHKPEGWISWRQTLNMSPKDKSNAFENYFSLLKKDSHPHAKKALAYLLKSREFANHLVKSGVANSIEDVNSVLELGFHHSYGPGNLYY